MAEERLVEQHAESRRYLLGPLAFELGLAAEQHFDLRSRCRHLLESLARETEDTAYLIVRGGIDAVCLDRVEGLSPIRVVTLDIGSRRPLGLGAGGLAILAALPDEERESLLADLKPKIEKQWLLPGHSLARSVQQARDDGYALIRNRITAGTTAIGVCAKDSQGRPVAALSVAAVNARMGAARIDRVHQLLIEATREIQSLLGGYKKA
ncbi:transcriptional regulator, IclR family [Variovorax sp. YR266]|nr:transcriptional regulator, IclR family [Variovorax sp. YR266]